MLSDITISLPTTRLRHKSKLPNLSNHKIGFFQVRFVGPLNIFVAKSFPSSVSPLICGRSDEIENHKPIFDPHKIDSKLVQEMAYDALVWSSLRGLVVGDRNSQNSGRVPDVRLVHGPISLLPTRFPESHWKQACEVAPIFNQLIDRVSLDGKFLQDSLSRTKKVDAFTSRLLDIHAKMLDGNKKEVSSCLDSLRRKLIKLGLHRSDHMLDEQTNSLLQIELNTISSSFPGLSCLVSELHRSLLLQFKHHLALDPGGIPQNNVVAQFAQALAKAWFEYNNPGAIVVVVVQTEERNMYDQHWLCTVLKERYHVRSIRKTLVEIEARGKLLPDGTLIVDGESVAVVYFRAGYSPTEWKARLLMEQSSAFKCPSISYHLAGTKKIQQELAKPDILERFLENKDDIAKLRKCFAGLWSLDDSNIIKDAIKRPESYIMKPQREGGGNNIYGDDLKLALERMEIGDEENAAYIIMQRIFPAISPAILMREGIPFKDNVISELGVYAVYLRNKNKVIVNEHSGYLMRTKVSSSNEGGVAAGFGVLESVYLV